MKLVCFILVILAIALQVNAASTLHSRKTITSSEEDASREESSRSWVVESRQNIENKDDMPEVYKRKISERLEGSMPLNASPEIKQNLYKLADDKLKLCKSQSADLVDRQCFARQIGLMMQLIAAFENNARDLAGQRSWPQNN